MINKFHRNSIRRLAQQKIDNTNKAAVVVMSIIESSSNDEDVQRLRAVLGHRPTHEEVFAFELDVRSELRKYMNGGVR